LKFKITKMNRILYTVKIIIIFSFTMTAFSLMFVKCVTGFIEVEEPTIINIPSFKIQECDTTIVSVYWAVSDQTDNTPTITASGFEIKDVNNPPRIAAVPRNMIGTRYNFGDSIFIDSKEQYFKGWWRIEDVMNDRYSYCNRIDLLVKPNYINLLKLKDVYSE